MLTLGLGEDGDEWDFQRIGTAMEKASVDKELAQLREKLAKVDQIKQRRADIEEELNRVWVEGGTELEPPAYQTGEAEGIVDGQVAEGNMAEDGSERLSSD